MKVIRYAWLTAVLMLIGFGHSSAQAPDPPHDLTAASLEELMNIEVTSVSKKEEKLFRTAAAIYVITQEEIRRSGLTSLPELIRLAPGMSVGRIDGTKWAISARGFNGRFANKLLVLIDGRSVYSPETAGVYWEAHHLPVEEIERIEVIRGPGGTLWGTNAVNGIINVITRHAKETVGGLMTAGVGSEEQGFTSARYGDRIGANAYYRVYARYFNRGGSLDAAGYNVHDWQNWESGGWRLDWKKSERDALTFQGDLHDTILRDRSVNRSPATPFAPTRSTPGEFTGGNLLGRWNHNFSDRSNTALQIYFDRARREVYDLGERIDTFDVDFQHRQALGRRQDMVWGLGYRLITDQTNTNSGTPVQYTPAGRNVQIFSGFVQDELMLIKNRLRLTIGAKLEHNDYSGYEAQPSVRLLWTPSADQTVWAAVSRAVRAPTRRDQGLRANRIGSIGPGGLPLVPALSGGANPKSEELRAYEFGYRTQLNSRLSLDVATFYNLYDRVQTVEPGALFLELDPQPRHFVLPLRFDNLMRGETYGIEAATNLNLTSRWKVQGSYSFLRIELHRSPRSRAATAESPEEESPRHQFQIHSRFNLPRNFELDTALYRVSRLRNVQIPGYTRLDLRFGWKVRESLALDLMLQNLPEDQHPEFQSPIIGVVSSQVKRSIYGKATWRF
ncbi:MAG TPA: TonB-dependent receptor [Blastocatellia bacterium]|nr:TonB-dependent receptor [Blastocatellia bacterium]